MKRLLIVLTVMTGVLTSAWGADESFDDTGWQQGPSEDWFVNWDKAIFESRKSGKPIFALSTGSDWCGWCKKLKKDVLTTKTFNDFAKKNLVLLYLDSPRKPLPEAQTLHNRTICRELRLGGGVPCAAVFAADARRLGVLSGGGYTASNYVERLEKILAEKGELPKSGQISEIFTKGYVEPPKEAVKWKYEIVGDGIVLGRGGKGFGPAVEGDAFGALVIPEKIDGKSVRGIGKSAFYGRSGLTSVTIPESVTNIGESAFYGCSGLKSLTIPSGVTSIGGFAFFGCNGLTSITLPKRMTSIGEFAFRSCSGLSSMTIPDGVTHIESATFLFCTGLKSVTIPASVERISPGAFAHCDNLTVFSVDISNRVFCSKNGMICSKNGSKLVVGVNGNVTIPDGVEIVKSCAFDDLAGLLTVKMPASVRTVDDSAFMGCSALKEFSVDASNQSFCSRNGLLCSKDGKTLVVGVNGDVTIPDGVTNIRPLAFHEFEGLKSIVLPDSVTSVGHRAFDGCSGLADKEGFVIVRGVLYGYVGRARSVKVPEGVTSIGECAFYWGGLKSITFPSSVTNIGASAFYCCKGLVDVDIKGTDVKIAKSAFCGDTPVAANMPDLSKPIGPIHVVVGDDKGENRNNGAVSSQATKNAPDSGSWQMGPSDLWFVKWDDAVAESKKTKKPIYVLSTGSDWCGWCIRLRKNVLSRPEFETYAKENLVLLYLDSPSKTPLCDEQKKHNQEVSRNLGLGGGVPNAAVVTAEGQKLGSISGGGLGLEAYLQKLGEIIGKPVEAKAENKPEAADVAAVELPKTVTVPTEGCKLPYDLMPKEGRIADFDFSKSITNKAVPSCDLQFTDGRIVDGTLRFEGEYVYNGGIRRSKKPAEIPLPGLNYDQFAVAMSFVPEGSNEKRRRGLPIFVLCSGWRKLEINVTSANEVDMCVNSVGEVETGLKVRRDAWNWFVCSVDAIGKRIVLAVNGQVFEHALPEDFCWRFPSAKTRDSERNATLFTHLGAGSATRGFVDDLLVYNRLFGRGDVADILQGRRPAETTAVKCQTGCAAMWPDTIPQKKWLFRPHDEKSMFWNGQIRSGNWSLDVHRDGETIIVQPYYENGEGRLDLSKPVETAEGATLRIVGIGYPKMWNTCPNLNKATEIILPRTLECVYMQAFAEGGFGSIDLPEGVKMIGAGAFSRCKNLRSIDIPESVSSIEDRAFQECERLSSVNIRGSGVKIAPLAFRGSTPIGEKMAALKSPVGPIEVTATGVDDGKGVKPEVPQRRVLGGMPRRRTEVEQQRREEPAKAEKSVEPVIKQYKLRYADPKEVARLIGQMFGNCKALCEERIGLVNVELPPDELARVKQFIQGLDIRPTELKLDLKVVRVADVESVDSALAKLTAAPDKAEVVFEQSVIAKENVDVHAIGLFAVCGKPTVLRFRCRSKSPALQSGDAPVEWEIACSNESGVVCALNGAQVIDGYGATTLGGFMVEECSGLFAFLQPAGINAAYLFQLSAKDLGQVLALQAGATESKNADLGGQGYGIEEKMLDEKCQEDLRRLAAQIRKKKLAAEK